MNPPTPQFLAEARAVVSDPSAYLDRPMVLQGAFLALKEAQGHPVTAERRFRVARALYSEFTGPAPRPCVNEIDAARQRAIGPIRAAIARLPHHVPTGGGAA
ncbi:hypothetical protein [Roseivivax isoporae]|uniref:Uncharacterized protein n=1 Tax=Roseivivax isoporae LMG 25204 TaxID=1449351 RepID=X7F185_9RHOB|nr:hypothetical protein [Roseivivax isoporae]ETX26505.1 hypothetical protein RISW2_23850 [Roseivivax isoporae LMG 25204]